MFALCGALRNKGPSYVLSCGSWPEHWVTGRRGYFGKFGSCADRVQNKNLDLRADPTIRAWTQSLHSPTFSRTFSGLLASATSAC